jgi:OTT_1508-like deaminase
MDAKEMKAALPELSPDFVVQPDDIHCLVAFAQKAQQRSIKIFVKERRTDLDQISERPNYATKKPWRQARCLDSLANICVSKPHGEVIAIGLRHDTTKLDIIVATNDDVTIHDREYLEKVWGMLCDLSKYYNNGKNFENTPPGDLATFEAVKKFRGEVIKHTYDKVLSRSLKNDKVPQFDSSVAIGEEVRDALHVWHQTSMIRSKLQPTEEDWDDVRDAYMVLAFAIDDYLEKYEERPNPFLEKVSGIHADMNQLLSAARSPSCKRIFSIKPNFIYLPKEVVKISLPADKSGWQKKEHQMLAYFNSATSTDKRCPSDDSEKLCESLAKRYSNNDKITAHVHCEVKVAINLFTQQTTFEPYPYIGVSKLSCFGCSQFLKSFNKIHNVEYMTKGQHSKAYSPYGFPTNCPSSQEVLRQYYEEFDDAFVRWYSGFKRSSAKGPDSTAQSQPSGGHQGDPRELYKSSKRKFWETQ